MGHGEAALIHPNITQKGPRNLPCNYRPINLTSIACKIMESIIREHLMKHMIENNLFAEQQHGFLPGRSRATQLLDVLDDWFLNFDKNLPMDVIYLDMVRAFDTVPLHSYGITEKVHSWIRVFLTDRKQRTCINGTFSNWIEVLSGIPHGFFYLFIGSQNLQNTIIHTYSKYITLITPQQTTNRIQILNLLSKF